MSANRWMTLALILGLLGGVRAWLHRSIPHPPGMIAPDDPVQENLSDAASFEFKNGEYRIQPLALFDISARILSREDYNVDHMADLVPTDLALGWGPMSDSEMLSHFEISQSGRFFFWHTQVLPMSREVIQSHAANMHLIPADGEVRAAIGRLRVGQIVHFTGKLVEVVGRDGWHARSSLTRDDTGAGACEIIWVERLDAR